MFYEEKSVNQYIPFENELDVEVWIKREDLIHEIISGNKYRKLKYNISYAKANNYEGVLTFGGAFSNHIAAVAEAGKVFGLKTIGVIRGEELASKVDDNHTLKFAKSCGMHLEFVSRSLYKKRFEESYLKQLRQKFNAYYFVPEGGTNNLGVKGCEEILKETDEVFNYVCAAVGTGGTLSGLINCSKPSQQVLGFPALKGDFLQEDITKFANKKNWKLINEYHFGGYAKVNPQLIAFINQFKTTYGIALDPVYTGKMLYGIFKMITEGFFSKKSKLLIIHTGGLQGITGVNKILEKKQQPLIL